MKDWTGNSHTMSCLGAHNWSTHEREKHDYYATDPKAIIELLKVEEFKNVWECACGEGHLAKVLAEKGLLGRASDLIDRGYGENRGDFLLEDDVWNGDIITNPPYKYALQFITTSLKLVNDGAKVAMFLRVQFLESRGRYKLFTTTPPKTIYVFSGRVGCAINGQFGIHSNSAVPFAWYVWVKGYKDDPRIKWILI